MTSKMGEFLRAILPEQGLKVAAIVRGTKAPHHIFVNTWDELEKVLSTQDALGHTTYHACAAFATTDSRKGENALGAKAFWLDVDVGDKKGYPDDVSAYHAVIAFCRDTALPTPIFVSSGRGLHVYWPLTEMLPRDAWRRYAGGLKELCARQGLKVDPVRVADIASVLRTPGTHWRKEDPPRLVTFHEIEGPYNVSAFQHLLELAPAERPARPPRIQASGLAGQLLQSLQGENPNAEAIATACAQISAVRESRGAVSEPHWFGVAGVLAFSPDGLETALSWADPAYEHEIRKKFAPRERLSGPTTCHYFHSTVDRARCEACPLFQHITTPMQAPSTAPPKPVVQTLPQEPAAIEETKPWAGMAITEPYRFMNDGALVFHAEDKNGNPNDHVVSRYPIWLERVNTAEAQGNRYSYVLKQKLPKKGVIEIAISAGKMIGANGIAEIFEQGAVVQDRDHFRKCFVGMLEQHHSDRGVDMKYDQFGWKDDNSSFLWGRHLYRGMQMPETVSGGDEVMLRSQWLGTRPGADINQWREAAQTFFAAGNEPQAIALLAGFAAPLMKFHATDEGGAVVSLVSQKSGTGKTTALQGAASVWGQMDAINLTNIDTKVSKAITFGVLGNLPVIHDELSNRDPEVLKEFIVVFTNGRDKMRGTQEGGIRHTAARWQTLMITASNQSIVDLIQSTGVVDAPAYRVLELGVTVPPGRKAQSGDKLRQILDKNCGIAGHHFLQYLTQPSLVDYVRNTMPIITQKLWEQTRLEVQHRFWIRAAASITMAAHLVHSMGMLEFSPERLQGWLLEQMKDNQQETLSPESPQYRAPGLAALSDYLSDHISNILVVAGPYMARKMTTVIKEPNGRLLARYEVDERRLYIRESAFREWCTKKGYGSRSTVKELTDAGVLRQSRRYVTLSAGTQYPGGQMPCLEIDGSNPAMSGMLSVLEPVERVA